MKTLPRVLLSSLVVAAIVSAPLRAHAAPRAQANQPIRYGDTVIGTLSEETPCEYYTFEGTAGDPVTLDMARTGGNLDGTLALYRGDRPLPSSAPVAQNDDRPGGGLDPLIELRLPETGRYTIAACHLQAENMRVTTGTYTLTLSGPATPGGPTPTPAGALSDSLFGAPGSESAVTATPPPTATNVDSPLLGLLTGDGVLALAGGDLVEGTLDADTDAARYDLPVQAGDVVTLRWMSTGGDLQPRLHITGASGGMIAEATSADPTTELALTFTAPASETAALAVTRYAGALDGTAGTFTLAVAVQRPAGDDVAPQATSQPPDTAEASDYLTNACQSGGPALGGPTGADTLTGVYTAAGDSYYVEELTRTTVFVPDDDMNVVFEMHNTGGPAIVAGVFCAPDGSVFDAGEGEFEVGGPFLIGLDWEFYNEAWHEGAWYAELYVNGTLALTLAFNVAQ